MHFARITYTAFQLAFAVTTLRLLHLLEAALCPLKESHSHPCSLTATANRLLFPRSSDGDRHTAAGAQPSPALLKMLSWEHVKPRLHLDRFPGWRARGPPAAAPVVAPAGHLCPGEEPRRQSSWQRGLYTTLSGLLGHGREGARHAGWPCSQCVRKHVAAVWQLTWIWPD